MCYAAKPNWGRQADSQRETDSTGDSSAWTCLCYLALRQHQTFHRLLVKHLQLLYQVDPGSQTHSLQQPAISWRWVGGMGKWQGRHEALGPSPLPALFTRHLPVPMNSTV